MRAHGALPKWIAAGVQRTAAQSSAPQSWQATVHACVAPALTLSACRTPRHALNCNIYWHSAGTNCGKSSCFHMQSMGSNPPAAIGRRTASCTSCSSNSSIAGMPGSHEDSVGAYEHSAVSKAGQSICAASFKNLHRQMPDVKPSQNIQWQKRIDSTFDASNYA